MSLNQFYTVDVAGQDYLNVVLGIDKDDLENYCLERADVMEVQYYENTISILSSEDNAEYENVVYACHTDINYYAYGLAGKDLPEASTVFENSARCFLYDNDENKVFALVRTDPESGIKTCERAFPCISKQDFLSGEVYATCGIDVLNKTLEGIPGRTYWPYFILYVTVGGVTHIITIINLHTGEELKTENSAGSSLVSFPCLASDITRHLGMRVQTWPIIAIADDWVERTSYPSCPDENQDNTTTTDTDILEISGTYPGPLVNITQITTDTDILCTSFGNSYYTADIVETIQTTRYGTAGSPSSYINQIYTSIDTEENNALHNWYHTTTSRCAMENPPNAGTFYNLILSETIENVYATNVIDITRDYNESALGWPSGYRLIEETDIWSGANTYTLSGTYTQWNYPNVSSKITTSYQRTDNRLGATDPPIITEEEEIEGAYTYRLPNEWQQREPLPSNSIPLFERWYGYLTNWVFMREVVTRERSYNDATSSWNDWDENILDFYCFDVVPQIYLAKKRDSEDDSTLNMETVDKVRSIASIISDRTKTFLNSLGYESLSEFSSSIDFEDGPECDLYYAKYDMNARKYI